LVGMNQHQHIHDHTYVINFHADFDGHICLTLLRRIFRPFPPSKYCYRES
jgi:hypothetical protein